MAYSQQLALACSHTAEIRKKITSRLQHGSRLRQSCTPGFWRIYRADLPWTRMYAGIYAYTYVIRIRTSQPYFKAFLNIFFFLTAAYAWLRLEGALTQQHCCDTGRIVSRSSTYFLLVPAHCVDHSDALCTCEHTKAAIAVAFPPHCVPASVNSEVPVAHCTLSDPLVLSSWRATR